MRQGEKVWRDAVAIEPRLSELFRQAKAIRDPGGEGFCANEIWYEFFKPRLSLLVGWEAEQTALGTTEFYDVTYDKIYDVLPNCRHCSCYRP